MNFWRSQTTTWTKKNEEIFEKGLYLKENLEKYFFNFFGLTSCSLGTLKNTLEISTQRSIQPICPQRISSPSGRFFIKCLILGNNNDLSLCAFFIALFVHFWSTMHPVVLLVIEMIMNDGTYKMRSLKGVKITSDRKIIGHRLSC